MNTAMHRAAEPMKIRASGLTPMKSQKFFSYLASDESREVHGQRFQAQDEDELKDTTTKEF